MPRPYTLTRTKVSAWILMPRAYTLTVGASSTKLFCFCFLSQFRSILFPSVPFLLSQLPCHNTGGRSMVAVHWRLLLTLFSALHIHIARQQLHIVVCSSTHDMHTCTCTYVQKTASYTSEYTLCSHTKMPMHKRDKLHVCNDALA